MLNLILLIFAIPTGFLIAWLARDELVKGRKWFKVIFILGILSGIWMFLTNKTSIVYISFFMSIVSIISYMESFDKKWTKKKI